MDFTQQLFSYGFRYVIGVDEVGRGPLAGPVVSAAVCITHPLFIEGLKDSKLLTEKKREHLEKIIKKSVHSFSYGIVDPGIIDEIGILEASKQAMVKAVMGLSIPLDDSIILIDGNFSIPIDSPQMSIVKGDRKVPVISAASILAKVLRDKIMMEFDKLYPYYGFSRHKGYPTKQHINMLKKLGPTPIHRRSFKYCSG